MIGDFNRESSPQGLLAGLGIEAISSIEAVCAFLGEDDVVRDAFPPPDAAERDHWLQLWDDDSAAFEAMLWHMIGDMPADVRGLDEDRIAWWCIERMREFCQRDIESLDAFFRSAEVRFVIRTFLPCVARNLRRPSALLSEIVATGSCELLESAVMIDSIVIHHKKLSSIVNPPVAQVLRDRWELLNAALSKTPEPLEPRQVKYAVGAMLRWLAELMGERLTVPAIASMFDEFARASGLDEGDPDMIDPERFRKGVRRFQDKLPQSL